MYKIVLRICNTFNILIIACILAILVMLTVPRIFGYTMFAVLSGSMEPHYQVGSIVYIDKNITPQEISVGDPIAFYRGEKTVATHRVTSIDKENETFATKGDANDVVDGNPVEYKNFIGKATVSIPYIGYLTVGIQSRKGMILACGLLAFMILLYIIPEIFKPNTDKEDKAKENVEQV